MTTVRIVAWWSEPILVFELGNEEELRNVRDTGDIVASLVPALARWSAASLPKMSICEGIH